MVNGCECEREYEAGTIAGDERELACGGQGEEGGSETFHSQYIHLYPLYNGF